MNPFKKYLTFLAAGLFWLLPVVVSAKAPVTIQVSILPQKYIVERIGKDRIHVDVLVKPGKSPEIYSPSPDQIKTLMAADIYFRIGIDFENGIMDKIESFKGLKIVDTRDGIVLRDMKAHGHDAKDHDADLSKDKENHGHTGKDPHIWMSPENVKIQAYTVFKTLSEFDPDGRAAYQINYDLFSRDMDDLDLRLKTILKDFKGTNIFVFHPAFGYFTDRYGLHQIAVETMGKAPKGKELSNIIKLAKKEKTRVIFVQPQFDRSAAEKIASAINGAVVSVDTLAYDYPANMESIAETIAKALK